MKSDVDNNDEIEVLDEGQLYGRIRVRELQSGINATKASVYLTAEQLVLHAQECLKLAERLRMIEMRKTPDHRPQTIHFASKLGQPDFSMQVICVCGWRSGPLKSDDRLAEAMAIHVADMRLP